MVAFGLVVGFLLGGYFITIHENSFGTGMIPADIYPGHPKWIGAWWCGFVLLGVLLILVSPQIDDSADIIRRMRDDTACLKSLVLFFLLKPFFSYADCGPVLCLSSFNQEEQTEENQDKNSQHERSIDFE